MINTLCDFTNGCSHKATRWGLLSMDDLSTPRVASCEYHSYRWSALWGTWPMDSVDVDADHAEAMEEHVWHSTERSVSVMVGDVVVTVVPALNVFRVVVGGTEIGRLRPVTWLRNQDQAHLLIRAMLADCGVLV